MTRTEIQIAQALRQVAFPKGSADKRFARTMEAQAHRRALEPITPEQSVRLHRIARLYRHQLPAQIADLA